MAISTGDLIHKFGTQDAIDDGSTSAVNSGSYSVDADITTWTNTDDAPAVRFILKCQFATMPTIGAIELYGRPKNIMNTTGSPAGASDNYKSIYLGTFPIDFGAGNATDFYTVIPDAHLPNFKSQQEWDFRIKNYNTGQSISANWELEIVPVAFGPA